MHLQFQDQELIETLWNVNKDVHEKIIAHTKN